MRVQDASGTEATATVLDGPTLLNTPDGEFCAEVGQIAVQYAGQKPLVLTPQQFADQFTEI